MIYLTRTESKIADVMHHDAFIPTQMNIELRGTSEKKKDSQSRRITMNT